MAVYIFSAAAAAASALIYRAVFEADSDAYNRHTIGTARKTQGYIAG